MASSYSDRDIGLIPAITFSFVENYIKCNKFSSGNKSINQGFKLYNEGYIHKLKVYPIPCGCKVVGKCHQSEKKKEPYTVEVQFMLSDDVPSVSKADCVCAIGAMGCCGHIAGLLYQLAQYKMLGNKALPEQLAKTALPQTWHTPRGLQMTSTEVQDLEVCGYSRKEEGLAAPTKPMGSSLYNPVRGAPPNWTAYYPKLAELAPDSLILPSLELYSKVKMVPSKFGPVPTGSVLSYQQKLSEDEFVQNVFDGIDFPKLPFQNVMIHNYCYTLDREQQLKMECLILTLDDIEHTQEDTRVQRKSPLWYEIRKHRITASVIGRIYKRKKDDESLAKQLKSTRDVTTAAMRRGIASEEIAARKYAEALLNRINLYPCGVVVNFWAPWIAATPDRKVYNPTRNPPFGLLEIKCPLVSSILEASCLKRNTDGKLKLKRNHDYYYQVLTQLAVVGLEWCDLFVWCENDYFTETIYFNQDIWKNVKDKVDMFFFTHFI
ncbi:uncharacterized protein LOC123538734 [Mercenaria mercenaria]|uniref:uncharacterized protein LOC123538734 n=1 Tax=Mercenaria mercenaria TaxID=6596 RepID=UPI00234F8034|nr:uncharacterized protein LOC123538734 [Mercenaria mercenaria]